jgi:hypothetical protein
MTTHATKTKTKQQTPTQRRALIVSLLKRMGYTTGRAAYMHEFGRAKAWLRKPANLKAKSGAARAAHGTMVAAVLKGRGLEVTMHRAVFGGEWIIDGPGYSVTLFQDSSSGNGGGAFVQCVPTTSPAIWASHDGDPSSYR